MKFIGQWCGELRTQGMADVGVASLNVEADRPDVAFACIYQGGGIPSSRVWLSYQVHGDNFSAAYAAPPVVYDPATLRLVAPADHPRAQEFTYSPEIRISGKISGNSVAGEWQGSAGVSGTFSLSNTAGIPTKADHTMNWSDFKSYCSDGLFAAEREALFRGQASSAWPLMTSFHRLGRYDLIRYREEACSLLAREFNARLGRRYDLANGSDFGAVLSLAQHHGFPTPLLDWSRSPYVAAYFAYATPVPAATHARLYVLDVARWNELPQPATITDPTLAVSIREFEAYDNPRHIPQQSFHTFSNVADIEGWFRYVGKLRGTDYLTTIDLPRGERKKALRELAYMGVTAATLFPGIDGACRSLRERLYGPAD